MKNALFNRCYFLIIPVLCGFLSSATFAAPMWSGMLIVDRSSSIHSEAAREKPALNWPLAIYVDEESNAFKEGLRSGDYIIGTAGKETTTTAELETILEKSTLPLKIMNAKGVKILSYAPSPASDDVLAYLRIRSYLRLGKVQENIEAIRKVIKEHSKSPIVNFMAAFAFGAVKERDLANNYLQETIRQAPETLLGRICLKRLPKDQQAKMEEELKQTASAAKPPKTVKDPGKDPPPGGPTPESYGSEPVVADQPSEVELGSLISLGDFQTAPLDKKIEILREQIAKNPNSKALKPVLCGFLLQKVKVDAKLPFEDLENLLREATDLGVDQFKPAYVWGDLLFQRKNYDVAVQHLEEASKINPDHLDCTMKLAIGLQRCLKYEESIPYFERARKKIPTEFTLLYFLAYSYFELKDYDKAIEIWEEALKYAPTPNDAKQVQAMIQKAKEQDAATGGGSKDENQRFIVHYFGDSQKDIGDMTIEVLEEIYDQVTADFSYKPDIKITVIFFRTEDFAKVNNAPQWAGALAKGEKILVPLRQGYSDMNSIKGILAHEFTHVIINLRTNQRCPTWIHEGLAVNEEFKGAYGDYTTMRPDFEKCFRDEIQEKKRLFPLMQIQLNAGTYQADVNLGYTESYLAMRYFIEKWNWSGVDELMTLISQGNNLENAIEQVSGRPISQFQKEFFDWVMGVQ